MTRKGGWTIQKWPFCFPPLLRIIIDINQSLAMWFYSPEILVPSCSQKIPPILNYIGAGTKGCHLPSQLQVCSPMVSSSAQAS